ncbi:MAG: helix-turn-helix domain-containing protein [Armatimonadota bacterium]|nr:helix-turn-helix domain-containing protein [Armatimonadota bacterium]
MSTLESKLEAWLRYVAKQEEAIKQGDPALQAEESKETPAQMQWSPSAAAAPASTPTLAPKPTVTATIERQIRQTTPEPDIPEVEDFLPILRRPQAPAPAPEPAKPEPPTPQVIQRPAPAPIRFVSPPPAPPPPSAPPAPPVAQVITPQAPPTPPAAEVLTPQSPLRPAEASLFTPQVGAPAAHPPAPAPQPAPAPPAVRAQTKPVEPPAPMKLEGAREMWDRLPRHIQLLVGLQDSEVAQRSYKRFKENREELVERLLDPTLSLEETARILNVCPTTVRRYTNKDSLRSFRTAGNQRRFRLSDVLAFMEAQAKPE